MRYRFKAHITFLTSAVGGRMSPAVQGYRPDFFYEGETERGFMIWPKFLDEQGRELAEMSVVPGEADAMMYILSDELAESVHRGRIRKGVMFALGEGRRIVAKGIVLEPMEYRD